MATGGGGGGGGGGGLCVCVCSGVCVLMCWRVCLYFHVCGGLRYNVLSHAVSLALDLHV